MTVVDSGTPPTELGDDVHPVARTAGLTKRYGRTTAVRDLDLHVTRGEVVGFLGPNGSGKTTVLRVLTGALRPTSGRVSVRGIDPFRDPRHAHQELGYLPGDLRLPPHMTGRELLDLCAAVRARPARDRDRLVRLFEVSLDVRIGSLSKGNRQKIGIVQAFMSRPALLLLDEPTSGLDPLAQEALEDEIRRASDTGAAVLLSSHLLREAEQVVDRVVLLREGRQVADSTLDAMRADAPYRVEGDTSSAVVHELAQLPGVQVRTTAGRRTELWVPPAALHGVLEVLSRSEVRGLHVTPPDLETLFLSYFGTRSDS